MRKNYKINVSKHFSAAMCCGCGMCVVACPVDALSMRRNVAGVLVPVVNESICSSCEKCLKVCPGINAEFEKLHNTVYGHSPKDSDIGPFEKIYTGFANDIDIRNKSSSGGAITATLLYLLRNKRITGAVVVRMCYGETISAESFLATNEADIVSAKGSKYCPVSFDRGLKQLKNHDGVVAIVCLPCQAIGLRKLLSIDPELKQKVVYIFGLLCGQCPSYYALDYFISMNKMRQVDIKEFSFRGDGWPGKMKIVNNDKKILLSYIDQWSNRIMGTGFFTPLSCYCCYDYFAEFADVSFGDAWLKDFNTDSEGTSLIITRTKSAEKLIKELIKFSVICNLKEIDKDRIKSAFAVNIIQKKRHYGIHKQIVPGCPDYIKQISRCDIKSYCYEFIRFLKIIIGHYRPLLVIVLGNGRRILKRILDKISNKLLLSIINSKNRDSYFK